MSAFRRRLLDPCSQLRQACIHPQLTKAWREMAAEGQLGLGTALSMEEIMQRLVDQAQFDLQVWCCRVPCTG